jgi:predicted dienelactone hydrolase
VLIFSSILGIPPPAESAIVNDVASHGFVVVSIYHTYVTGPVGFSDGELVVEYVDNPLQDTLPITVADIHFVRDQVEDLAVSDPRFENALDLDRVGVFGFALGGTSAAEASVDEPRFLAALNIDGPAMGRALEEGLEQPFLLISARSAPNRLNPEDLRPRFLDGVRGPAYSLTLPSAGGMNFCDYALHEPLMQAADSTAAIPDLGTIDRVLAFQIINDYIVAFFATHVAGTPDPLLSEPSPYPEASFLEWE